MHLQKMQVMEIRMLRWICDHTKTDKIRNETIRKKLEVAYVANEMRKDKLNLKSFVERRIIYSDIPNMLAAQTKFTHTGIN